VHGQSWDLKLIESYCLTEAASSTPNRPDLEQRRRAFDA
jgi:hypothetical protein